MSTEATSATSWQVRFSTDSGEHELRVTREDTNTWRPVSCDAEAEPVGRYVVS